MKAVGFMVSRTYSSISSLHTRKYIWFGENTDHKLKKIERKNQNKSVSFSLTDFPIQNFDHFDIVSTNCSLISATFCFFAAQNEIVVWN